MSILARIHKNSPPSPSSSESATCIRDPIVLPTASLVDCDRHWSGILWSCTQNVTESNASSGALSTSTAGWKITKLLSYDHYSNSSTRSRSIASSNSNSRILPPMSLIFISPIGFHKGLKVRLTALALTTLFVKNFAVKLTMVASFFRGTSAPYSSSFVNKNRNHRSSMLDITSKKLSVTTVWENNKQKNNPTPSYQSLGLKGNQRPPRREGQNSTHNAKGLS